MVWGKYHMYGRYLVELPWLKQGIFTNISVVEAYSRIRRNFADTGFRIVAHDDKSLRFCAYRDRGEGQCTCVHVVWIVRNGHMAYVSYGVDPRFFLFSLCGKGDHLDKLRCCGQIIRDALAGL